MRRRLGLAALLSTLSLVVAGCTAISDGTPALDGEIVVGVAVDKSGAAAALGIAEEKAILLAAEKINKEGVLGKKLKLIITDTHSSDAEAVREITALADNPRVVGIVGPGSTATTMPVLPIIEQKKITLVSMGADEAIVTPPERHKYSFKTPHNGAAVVEVMMRECKLRGFTRIAMLAAANQFGDYGVAAVNGATKQASIQLVKAERFVVGEKDYSKQVASLIAAQPQAIVVSAFMPFAGYAAKAIKDANYTGRVFFDPSAGSDVFLSGAGTAAEDMYMVGTSILAADHTTATTPSVLAQKEFFAEYTQRYGSFSGYASYGADALDLLVTAIRKANDTDRTHIRDALETVEFDGLTGSYKFSPTNHGGASADGLTILTVQKGGWVLAP